MFTNTNRILLFLLLCIPLRIIISIIPLFIPIKYLQYYSLLTGYLSFSFIYLYLTNKRLNAPEGGGITWWKDLRIIHSLLYLTSTVYLIQNKRLASLPLILDIITGLIGFIFLR